MFDIVDTVFSYERELIVCSFVQDFSKGKGISLQLIWNAHTAFLLCTAVMNVMDHFPMHAEFSPCLNLEERYIQMRTKKPSIITTARVKVVMKMINLLFSNESVTL